jgi:hypothetical protein
VSIVRSGQLASNNPQRTLSFMLGSKGKRRCSEIFQYWIQGKLPYAVTLQICALSCGCLLGGSSGPLPVPSARKVGSVGRSLGLPLTVSVVPPLYCDRLYLDRPITLQLKMINVTQETIPFPEFKYIPERRFAIWLMHDGRQVVPSEYGETVMPRFFVNSSSGVGGGPVSLLAPGAARVMEIDLAREFQIRKPGAYTAIVEEGPVQEGTDDRDRELASVQTSFVIYR